MPHKHSALLDNTFKTSYNTTYSPSTSPSPYKPPSSPRRVSTPSSTSSKYSDLINSTRNTLDSVRKNRLSTTTRDAYSEKIWDYYPQSPSPSRSRTRSAYSPVISDGELTTRPYYSYTKGGYLSTPHHPPPPPKIVVDPNPVRIDETYPYAYQPPAHPPSTHSPLTHPRHAYPPSAHKLPLPESPSHTTPLPVPPLSLPPPPPSPPYRDFAEVPPSPPLAPSALTPPLHPSPPLPRSHTPLPPSPHHVHLSDKKTKKLENSLEKKLEQQKIYAPHHTNNGYLTPPLSPNPPHAHSSSLPSPSYPPLSPPISPTLSLRRPPSPTPPPSNPSPSPPHTPLYDLPPKSSITKERTHTSSDRPRYNYDEYPPSPSPPHTPLYELPLPPKSVNSQNGKYTSSGRPSYNYDEYRKAMASLTFRTTYQQAFTPPKIPHRSETKYKTKRRSTSAPPRTSTRMDNDPHYIRHAATSSTISGVKHSRRNHSVRDKLLMNQKNERMPYYIPDHLRSLTPQARHRSESVLNKSLHTDFHYGEKRPRTPPKLQLSNTTYDTTFVDFSHSENNFHRKAQSERMENLVNNVKSHWSFGY